ncbi:MAG: hypothetical protein JJU00_11650 [Opitutales bacterium]|nr:hypothetical protein [Opitutales bacterium]
MNSTHDKTGFTGTGEMGAPMCANLLAAGYTLTVYDHDPSRVRPLVEAGAAQLIW